MPGPQGNKIDKVNKATAKELEKLCAKIEKLCVPMQELLLRVSSGPTNIPALERLESFQETLSIVNGGLFAVQERAADQGTGASKRMAAKIVRRMREREPLSRAEADSAGAIQGQKPSLRGRSGVFSLMGVLQFVGEQGKTGVLTVDLKVETITLHVKEGALVHVSCNPMRSGERLGELLAQSGEVSMEHMHAFLDSHRDSPGTLGLALVEKGLVSEATLGKILQQQLQLRLDRALQAEDADFEFVECPVAETTGLSIEVADLRLDADAGGVRIEENSPTSGSYAPAIGLDGAVDPGEVSAASNKWKGGASGGWGGPRPK